ncbi:MAG: Lrp/AsnC family transcriptional regulator [Steroidobacteraceae bacterium]
MDRYDREILAHLQVEGRISVAALAERIALSSSATLRRIQALEASGVIAGYRAVLDAQKLGHEVRAFVEVNADRANPDHVEQFLKRVTAMPEVLSCYMVSGSVDFVLEVVAPSLSAYADFIDTRLLKLRGVKDASSRLVLRTIKPPSPYAVR